MMCPAPSAVKVYGCCPTLTTCRDTASATLRDQEGQGDVEMKGSNARARSGTYEERLAWSAGGRSPCTRGHPATYSQMYSQTYSWTLCSVMGIWLEIMLAGEAEGTAIGLPAGGPGALEEVDRGEVQGGERCPLGESSGRAD